MWLCQDFWAWLLSFLDTPKSKHNSEVLPEFIILTSITQSILDFQIQKQKYSSNWSTMLLTTISKISSDITTTNKQLNKQNWWWRHEPLSHKACEEMLKLIQHLFLVAWVQYHFLYMPRYKSLIGQPTAIYKKQSKKSLATECSYLQNVLITSIRSLGQKRQVTQTGFAFNVTDTFHCLKNSG